MTYLCWIVGLRDATQDAINAESSFAARKIKASKHTAADLLDVVARRADLDHLDNNGKEKNVSTV